MKRRGSSKYSLYRCSFSYFLLLFQQVRTEICWVHGFARCYTDTAILQPWQCRINTTSILKHMKFRRSDLHHIGRESIILSLKLNRRTTLYIRMTNRSPGRCLIGDETYGVTATCQRSLVHFARHGSHKCGPRFVPAARDSMAASNRPIVHFQSE